MASLPHFFNYGEETGLFRSFFFLIRRPQNSDEDGHGPNAKRFQYTRVAPIQRKVILLLDK